MQLCPGQESNLHDQNRSLGPQPSASTSSATWAKLYQTLFKNFFAFSILILLDGWRKPRVKLAPPYNAPPEHFFTVASLPPGPSLK